MQRFISDFWPLLFPQRRMSADDIPALTGLRGFAACWVVIYHMHEFQSFPEPLGQLIRHGYLAVDVFFVLSGFVMALSYMRLFSDDFSLRSYRVFLIRRFARIYPLYIVITVAIVIVNLRHADFRYLAILVFENVTLTEA